jgi:hypothetical protein
MAAPTRSVTKLGRKRGAAKAADPGQLDRFDDGSWEFTGNGKASAQDVAAGIIDYEKSTGEQPEYENIRSDTLAKLLLEQPENSALNTQLGGDVTRPIPAPGPSISEAQSTFKAEVATLKQLVGMLMQHESQLRAGLTTTEASSESNKLTGNVATNGLVLPYEP